MTRQQEVAFVSTFCGAACCAGRSKQATYLRKAGESAGLARALRHVQETANATESRPKRPTQNSLRIRTESHSKSK
ncbi:hypothetical protein PLANPX_2761 [Lacipirellula parvula]|uniref:Uncharacterized protein n=1 Tax=Lacipirellula parvula TaxID=2650471 RepID=A0A5K7XJT6_9BACT|nr:hypothetical protein PLANPX_2761 [Lacipirellula parvula]